MPIPCLVVALQAAVGDGDITPTVSRWTISVGALRASRVTLPFAISVTLRALILQKHISRHTPHYTISKMPHILHGTSVSYDVLVD